MRHLLAAALIAAASAATAQDLPCLSPEQTPRIMADLGMTLQVDALGVNRQGNGDVQFWVHPNGNWYMFLIYSDGTGCPGLWGSEWWDGELM
jgi:hypothetical protein